MVSRIDNVRIAGIASAVPANVMSAAETAARVGIGAEDAQKIALSTGVHRRHVAHQGTCTSDLAVAAAEKLLSDLGWEKNTIDGLVFLTQGHDYLLPNTACILQEKLGLPKSCASFDMTLGCSGYIYGMWISALLVSGGSAKRVLFLAGDIATGGLAPNDRAVVFLFGDAASATGLTHDPGAPTLTFTLGTDGSGKEFIMQPAGGSRHRPTPENVERTRDQEGVLRSPLDLQMNGPEVFAFTLKEVPSMVRTILAETGWTSDDMEGFVPHQANLFILQHLAKRMKIPPHKLVLALEEFGNTSSASIPLAMSHQLAPVLREQSMNLVLAGFGVGWSWGALAAPIGPLVMSDIVYVDTRQEDVT